MAVDYLRCSRGRGMAPWPSFKPVLVENLDLHSFDKRWHRDKLKLTCLMLTVNSGPKMYRYFEALIIATKSDVLVVVYQAGLLDDPPVVSDPQHNTRCTEKRHFLPRWQIGFRLNNQRAKSHPHCQKSANYNDNEGSDGETCCTKKPVVDAGENANDHWVSALISRHWYPL